MTITFYCISAEILKLFIILLLQSWLDRPCMIVSVHRTASKEIIRDLWPAVFWCLLFLPAASRRPPPLPPRVWNRDFLEVLNAIGSRSPEQIRWKHTDAEAAPNQSIQSHLQREGSGRWVQILLAGGVALWRADTSEPGAKAVPAHPTWPLMDLT